MSTKKYVYFTNDVFQKMRFDASKEILASIITSERINKMTEQKQRESMAYMCVQMADALMMALDFQPRTVTKDGSQMHDITKLMAELKKDDD
jgi:hypothetical protein